MAITETKIDIRKNTDTPFFANTANPTLSTTKSHCQPFLDAGTMTSTITLSDDQLTRTMVLTYRDLDIYSQCDSGMGIDLDYAYVNYVFNNSAFAQITEFPDGTTPYAQSGIDSPFTATLSYSFPTGGSDAHNHLISTISAASHLTNLAIGDQTVTGTFTFANSADFNQHYFKDLLLIAELNAAGATRTIQYASV
jgi:hypothetical protein